MNPDACFCHHEVCSGTENYCDLSKGCQYIEECPQDLTLYDTAPLYCFCGGLLMDATTHYCMNNMTIVLPPDPCPAVPDLAPAADCVCGQKMVCTQGLMCEVDTINMAASGTAAALSITTATCSPRPTPCPELPEVAPYDGCYCAAAHEICGEGDTCDETSGTCETPATCVHPAQLGNWTDYGADIDPAQLDSAGAVVQGTELEVRCGPHSYRRGTLARDSGTGTLVSVFTVTPMPKGLIWV